MTDTLLTRDHDGQTVAVALGTRIHLWLDETPTTGYTWVDRTPGDALVLDSDEFATTAPPGVMGGGGHRHFQFTARAPGTTRLQLQRMQAWVGEASTVDRFSAVIHTAGPADAGAAAPGPA